MDDRIKAAVEYISENYACRIAVADLAKRAYLSTSRFPHLFKEETGVSARQFIIQKRLAVASRLLAEEGRLVKEAAYEVGYRHVSNFCHHFQETYGEPAANRRRPKNAKQS